MFREFVSVFARFTQTLVRASAVYYKMMINRHDTELETLTPKIQGVTFVTYSQTLWLAFC